MKKRNLNSIILLGILCIVLSCGKKTEKDYGQTNNSVRIINVPEDFTHISHLDSVFSDIAFIPLETKDECLISSIFMIKIADSLIYINNNRQQLLVFGMDGKFKSETKERDLENSWK